MLEIYSKPKIDRESSLYGIKKAHFYIIESFNMHAAALVIISVVHCTTKTVSVRQFQFLKLRRTLKLHVIDREKIRLEYLNSL